MPNPGGRLVVVGGVLFVATLATVCSKPVPTAQPSGTKPLIGEITPVVSVKELMEHMIDPIADNIFDAVWWDNTTQGVVEHKPTTDEDWEKVRIGATTMIEGIELLKVPRPFEPPG